jgi:hypothetical protein
VFSASIIARDVSSASYNADELIQIKGFFMKISSNFDSGNIKVIDATDPLNIQ